MFVFLHILLSVANQRNDNQKTKKSKNISNNIFLFLNITE
jgi:hypothetical protein